MGRALSRLSGFLVLKLVINRNATQEEKARAVGVPLVTVKRYVKLYREGGAAAFFPTRGPLSSEPKRTLSSGRRNLSALGTQVVQR